MPCAARDSHNTGAMGDSASAPPSRAGVFLRTFQAFRYRDFRLMWTGACTSAIGTWMQLTAQSWLVLTLTNSPFYLGLIGFLSQLPIVLLALLGGAAADRVDRRKLLLFSTCSQMVSAFILTLLVFAGVVQLWHFLVLVTLVGTAQAFGAPAYAALIPGLVKRRDMANAVALNSIQFNLALVIGPVLAGLIMTSYGAVACFGLNGLSFVAVICSLYLIKSSFRPAARKETVWEGIRNGLRFVRARKALWQLSLLGFVLTFSALPMTMLLPVYARDIYGMGPEGYAGMMTCSGIGAVVGALISANLGWMSRRGRFSIQVQVVLALLLALFAVSTNLYLGLLLLFLCRVCLMVLFSSVMSLVQEGTTEEMRGRVLSIFNLAMRGGMPVGNLVAGLLASRFSAPFALLVGSVLMGGVAVYCLLLRVRVTRL